MTIELIRLETRRRELQSLPRGRLPNRAKRAFLILDNIHNDLMCKHPSTIIEGEQL